MGNRGSGDDEGQSKVLYGDMHDRRGMGCERANSGSFAGSIANSWRANQPGCVVCCSEHGRGYFGSFYDAVCLAFRAATP